MKQIFYAVVAIIQADRKRCVENLAKANAAINDAVFATAKIVFELAINVTSLWKSSYTLERLFFLKKVLSNPTLESQTLRYDLKKPFAELKEMKASVEWRPHLESNQELSLRKGPLYPFNYRAIRTQKGVLQDPFYFY